MVIPFSWLMALPGSPVTMLTSSGGRGELACSSLSWSQREHFSFLQWEYDVSYGIAWMPFVRSRTIHLLSPLLFHVSSIKCWMCQVLPFICWNIGFSFILLIQCMISLGSACSTILAFLWANPTCCEVQHDIEGFCTIVQEGYLFTNSFFFFFLVFLSDIGIRIMLVS